MASVDVRAESLRDADVALARSAVYRLLAQGFAYPTPETVGQLREQDLPLARAVADRLPSDLRAALGSTASAFRGARTSRLERVYRDALSHVHGVDCPPYEMDHMSGDVWRQGQELADLAGFYRAFGLDGADRERPDHVSVELEFLHLATYKEAWATAHGDEEAADLCRDAQRLFLADHALRWIPSFATRLEALAGAPGYQQLARLAVSFLENEAERFGLEIDVPPTPTPSPTLAGDGALDPALDVGFCEEET